MNENRPDIPIPAELPKLMQDFVVTVLRQQPDDLINHAATYFTALKAERDQAASGASKPQRTGGLQFAEPENEGDDDEEMTEEQIEDEQIALQYKKRTGRGRKSVSGERYDPTEDFDNDDPIKVVPKSDEQRKRLQAVAVKIMLLNRLDEEQLQNILDAMEERTVAPDDVVIQQGDDGDNFYIIETGTYDILIGDSKVGQYNDSGFFGELALMYNMPRAATIKAVSEGTLWSLDRKTFRQIIVKANAIKRTQFEEFLKSVEILANINEMERAKIADVMESKKFQEKEIIIKQGDTIDSSSFVYFLMSGTVSVTVDDQEVKQLAEGSYFGELALLSNKPRAATITVLSENATAGVLDVNAFERLLGPCKEVMERAIDNYAEEVANLNA